MADTPVPVVDTNPTTRFERKDVNLRAVVLVGLVLFVIVVFTQLVSWWVFDFLQPRDRATKVSPFPLAAKERVKLPEEPHLEQIDRMEQAKKDQPPVPLYEAEQQRLATYGWVNEEQQVVHIPIDRAMKLIVEQQRLRARPSADK